MDILGEDIAEKVTGELAAHVIWSFKVRPMVALTEKEAERRLDIAWEVWKALTHEHGYEATQAVRAVPEMLIAHLDKCPSEGMEGLITPVFDTKLVPIDGRANVSPERALSALAAKSGRVEPRGIALTGIDRKE